MLTDNGAIVTRRGIVLTWPALIVGCALLGGAACMTSRASGETPGRLTAEDRLEIQELLHKYMFVLDSCPDHNGGYAYADLYTED
jgi:hypothetical protein